MGVLDLVGFFLCLIRGKFLLSFMSNYTCYYVALMVVISFLSIWLYVGYKHDFMVDSSYGSYHVFTYECLVNECMT